MVNQNELMHHAMFIQHLGFLDLCFMVQWQPGNPNSSWSHQLHGFVQALLGGIHQEARGWVDIPNANHGRTIAKGAVQIDGDVEVDDVSSMDIGWSPMIVLTEPLSRFTVFAKLPKVRSARIYEYDRCAWFDDKRTIGIKRRYENNNRKGKEERKGKTMEERRKDDQRKRDMERQSKKAR